jgi:L-serine dehydratase
MFLSVFDLFKIGIGPSSSHTVGPMVAAARFIADLEALNGGLARVASVRCSLHGSLAWTGKGHASDRAVILGLAGAKPDTIEQDDAFAVVHGVDAEETLALGGSHPIPFRRDDHLIFDYGPALPGHANGLILTAFDAAGDMLKTRTYYSIGGGFVVTAEDMAGDVEDSAASLPDSKVPYPFASARAMLEMGETSGLSIA